VYKRQDFLELYEREKKVFQIIGKVEERGLSYNAFKSRSKAKKVQVEIDDLKQQLCACAGYDFNPDAPAQVIKALRHLGINDKLLLLKGKITTRADILRNSLKVIKKEKLTKFINLLLTRRGYAKVANTYLRPFAYRARLNNNIIYTSINPTDSRTGRMACKSPNLQNIPNPVSRKTGEQNIVRSCFTCRPGFHNYFFDYVQMEMAVFGLFANESRILEGYAAGEDIHGHMAAYLFGDDYTKDQRGIMKNINFGVIYGMGLKTMCLMYQMDYEKAKKLYRIYFKEFPTIRQFQEECRQRLIQDGYVQDMFGRRYSIPVGQAYKAVNALVQGSCAQIFKIGLIKVYKWLKHQTIESNILLPIHDELMIESREWKQPEEERLFTAGVKINMEMIEQMLDVGLQLRVSVAKTSTNWSEKKEIKC